MLAEIAPQVSMASVNLIEKIVSGAQTGADRAGLDFAFENGIAHGGWCPKGRKAEDGTIDFRYLLTETPSASYPQRTEWNVRDADATGIFSLAAVLTGGSKKTVEFAKKTGPLNQGMTVEARGISIYREMRWILGSGLYKNRSRNLSGIQRASAKIVRPICAWKTKSTSGSQKPPCR